MGNEGDTHVSERSHLRGPQLLAHPFSLPSGSCLCPFLFNNTAHTHTFRYPIYLPDYLSVQLSICRSYSICIIWFYGKTKWICHHLKDFSHKKQKRHLVISCLFCPQKKSPSHTALRQVHARRTLCIFITQTMSSLMQPWKMIVPFTACLAFFFSWKSHC